MVRDHRVSVRMVKDHRVRDKMVIDRRANVRKVRDRRVSVRKVKDRRVSDKMVIDRRANVHRARDRRVSVRIISVRRAIDHRVSVLRDRILSGGTMTGRMTEILTAEEIPGAMMRFRQLRRHQMHKSSSGVKGKISIKRIIRMTAIIKINRLSRLKYSLRSRSQKFRKRRK